MHIPGSSLTCYDAAVSPTGQTGPAQTAMLSTLITTCKSFSVKSALVTKHACQHCSFNVIAICANRAFQNGAHMCRILEMQALRGFARAAAAAGRQSVSVSQLPALPRWHAELGSRPLMRHPDLLAGQQTCFASMPLSTGKQRVVVLGTGWAAGRLTKDLNCNDYDITVKHAMLLSARCSMCYNHSCKLRRFCRNAYELYACRSFHPETTWCSHRCLHLPASAHWSSEAWRCR